MKLKFVHNEMLFSNFHLVIIITVMISRSRKWISTPQGKAYGQMLGDLELNDLPSLEDMQNHYKMNSYAELS